MQDWILVSDSKQPETPAVEYFEVNALWPGWHIWYIGNENGLVSDKKKGLNSKASVPVTKCPSLGECIRHERVTSTDYNERDLFYQGTCVDDSVFILTSHGPTFGVCPNKRSCRSSLRQWMFSQ